MILSAIVVACAMCADPDGVATTPPPVIAVHDADQTRGVEACTQVGAVVGTLRCAILPPVPGLDPAEVGTVFTIYRDDLDAGEADVIAVNASLQGRGIGSVQPEAQAPAPPFALSPDRPMHAA